MELSRRDAVTALAALGVVGGGVGLYSQSRSDDGDGGEPGGPSAETLPSDERVESVMIATAEVVYPAEVTGIDSFVAAFLPPRLDRSDHADGVRTAVAILDDRARRWYDEGFDELDRETRERLLREVGADTADEAPDGTDAERVRYYVVNELLLALYASPTGGELVGIENPQGHPGGTDTYQRGPR